MVLFLLFLGIYTTNNDIFLMGDLWVIVVVVYRNNLWISINTTITNEPTNELTKQRINKLNMVATCHVTTVLVLEGP